MKFGFIFLSFLLSFQTLAQSTLQGKVSDGGSPIEFASIFNLNNHKFVYTDQNGDFKLNGQAGDSLEIQHVSFHNQKLLVSNIPIIIVMEEKRTLLKEVLVIPSGSSVLSLKSEIKKNLQHGLAMNSDYLFEINPRVNSDFFLESIAIPIKFRKEYSNVGSLMIQLFKGDSSSVNSVCDPIGEVQYLPISSLKKEKNILVSFDNLLIKQNDNFFIFLKRVVPNQTLSRSGDSTNLSVNPFMYISKNQALDGQNSYVKKIGRADEWTNLSTWLGYSPSLNVTLNIIPID